jgi:hypothetical protein
VVHRDIISQILASAEARDDEFTNELSNFLDDGVSSILEDRREPYYTIAKNKIKHLISFDNPSGTVRTSYTEQMVGKLNNLYFRLTEEHKFSKTFIEICLESVRDGEYLNKDALKFLNEINKSIGG